jgi:hypothetical protein
MGFLDSMFKGGGKYPKSFVKSITQSAEALYLVVSESIQLAGSSNDLETKKSRLDYAMKKLVELIKLANEYSFLDFRKISSIYDLIREVRNEIKEMEMEMEPVQQTEDESRGVNLASAESPVKKPVTNKGKDVTICPYCSFQFPVIPQRRGPCPSCNKMIYVWYSTTQNMKKLVTEEDAHRIEKEISQHIEQYELLNKQDTLEKSEEEMKQLQAELMESNPTATLDDAYMFLLNNKIKKARSNSEKSSLYYLKALLLDNAGKDFTKDLVESRRLELQHLKTHEFVKKVQIITSHDCCKNCAANSDKVFTIQEALETMPLPHPGCSRPLHGQNGFCHCSYLIVND